MKEPVWLTTEQVKTIHARQLHLFGGPTGLRDEGALESAIGPPQNQWLYTQAAIPELAAAYAFGIARNHPFVDGNKRAAFLAMATFLILNDTRFDVDPDAATAVILALAAGELDENGLAGWIRDNCAPAVA